MLFTLSRRCAPGKAASSARSIACSAFAASSSTTREARISTSTRYLTAEDSGSEPAVLSNGPFEPRLADSSQHLDVVALVVRLPALPLRSLMLGVAPPRLQRFLGG